MQRRLMRKPDMQEYSRPLPQQVTGIPPPLQKLTFTHIFGKALGGRLDKAEILPVSAIRVGLLGSFAQSVWKMWVKVRPEGAGLPGPVSLIICLCVVSEKSIGNLAHDSA